MDARVCAWHPEREAAAACLGCGRPLCRECALDREGHILCRDCAEAIPTAAAGAKREPSVRTRAPYAALGLSLLWAAFYLFLQWAATRPEFHLTP